MAAMAWLVVRESLRSFGANRGLQAAATLAYYGFLSLMPMLLLAVFLLGLFVASSDRALEALAATVRGLYPDFNEAILRDVAKIAGQKAWGLASIVVLAWSMTPFAGALRAALHNIFKREASLHFVKAKLRDMLAVFWLMIFFVLFAASRVLLSSQPAWLGWLDLVDWMLPPLITAAVLAILYRVFAPLRLPWRALLIGGATASLLLAAMRPLFGLVLHYNPGFGYAFGSLKAIFLLLVWVYYLFAAILLGAETMANFHRRESLLLRRLFTTPAAAIDPLLERFVTTIPAGTTLFHDGDPGDIMFHILTGEIELTKGGSTVKTARPGDYFGEMSLLLQAPRTATATARTETRAIQISRHNFETIVRENPAIVLTLLHEMARRLKTTTEDLAATGR